MTVVNGVRLISNSEVQAFKLCSRKWWLAYVRGLAHREPEVQGIRSTGTRLHVGLEALYTPGVSASREDVLEALRDAQWADKDILLSRGWDATGLEKDFSLEMIMLEGYLDWLKETGADAYLEVVDAEAYLEAELPVPGSSVPVKIIGKLDLRLIDTRTGRKAFMDNKSVKTFKVPNLRQNQQFLHYELLETALGVEQPCDATYYNMLRRVRRGPNSKPPYYKRETVEHNVHELDAYRRQLQGVALMMDRREKVLRDGGDHQMYAPPTPGTHCDWKCPFTKVCPMFDDGSRVEDKLAAEYVTINPLDYYQGKEREEVEE